MQQDKWYSDAFSRLEHRLENTNYLLQKVLEQLGGGPALDVIGVAIPGYNVRKFDLSTERTTSNPQEVNVPGDVLTFYTDGSFSGIQLAIGSPANDWVPLGEFGNPYRTPVKIQKFYLAWTTQNNKYLRVHVGSSVGGAVNAGASLSVTTVITQTADTITFNQVTVGLTAVQLSSTSFTLKVGVAVKADDGNTDSIFVGDSTVSITNGFRLAAGQGVTVESSNVTNIYVVADAAGQLAHYIGV